MKHKYKADLSEQGVETFKKLIAEKFPNWSSDLADWENEINELISSPDSQVEIISYEPSIFGDKKIKTFLRLEPLDFIYEEEELEDDE